MKPHCGRPFRMKIESYMHALLPKLDLNIQAGIAPNTGSFTSYLIGVSEEFGGSIQPPANPIVNNPVTSASNPAQGEGGYEAIPPVNPNSIYLIDPVSKNSDEDIFGLSIFPMNPIRIL
jgi:hypothetical protein